MRDQSLYELLQVISTADWDVIHAAYRRLILRYHVFQNKTKTPKKKTPNFRNLGFLVPDFLVTRLGVKPKTY